MLKTGERLEPLGNGAEVIVSEAHKFSTDTVLLADFSAPRKSDTAVELGSGCGAIPLIWSRCVMPQATVAVELQKDAADMLMRTVRHNGLLDKISVLNMDLRESASSPLLPAGEFSLVVCNPPYKQLGSGLLNDEGSRINARHEESCTLKDIIFCATRLLSFGGRFCMCLRPDRLTEALTALSDAKLEPKRLRFVQGRKNKPPKLFLVEGRRGGKSGGLVMLPALVIEDDNGMFTEEMMKIYGDYKT